MEHEVWDGDQTTAPDVQCRAALKPFQPQPVCEDGYQKENAERLLESDPKCSSHLTPILQPTLQPLSSHQNGFFSVRAAKSPPGTPHSPLQPQNQAHF